jgi:hypothetical protein
MEIHPFLYEEFIRQIAESAVKIAEGTTQLIIGTGIRNKIPGISGYSHQIDVSISNGKNLLLVECKYWKKNISVDIALTFLGRIIDLKENTEENITGIIATSTGWQPGVEKIAKYYGIELWLAKSANEFGIKYKNQIILGVHDDITLSENVEGKIITPNKN